MDAPTPDQIRWGQEARNLRKVLERFVFEVKTMYFSHALPSQMTRWEDWKDANDLESIRNTMYAELTTVHAELHALTLLLTDLTMAVFLFLTGAVLDLPPEKIREFQDFLETLKEMTRHKLGL